MSSFDADLERLRHRVTWYAGTAVSLRRPGDLDRLREGVETLRRRLSAEDTGELASLSTIHQRHLDAVEARIATLRRLERDRQDSVERRTVEARQLARTERLRKLAPIALLGSVLLTGALVLLFVPAHGSATAASAKGSPDAAIVYATDEIARRAAFRGPALGPSPAPPAPPRKPVVFRPRPGAAYPGQAHDAPPLPRLEPAVFSARVAALREAYYRGSQCAVSGAGDERTLPSITSTEVAARQQAQQLHAELQRDANRAGPEAAALFADLAAEDDPHLSAIGSGLLGATQGLDVDLWLAQSLRERRIRVCPAIVAAAVARGGEGMHGALLEVARDGARAPAERVLVLEALASSERIADAVMLLDLTADETVGEAAGACAARILRRPAVGGHEVGALVADAARRLGRVPEPLLLVAAAAQGGAVNLLAEAARGGSIERRRAVLRAAKAYPGPPLAPVLRTLACDPDSLLREAARAALDDSLRLSDR